VLLSLIDPFSLQFAPTYHEYVLYSNEGDYEPTKYSPSSIVLSGQDIQLVEISVLDAKVPVSSSLLSSDADLAETMPCQSRGRSRYLCLTIQPFKLTQCGLV
jgi:hypothetical protein